MSSCWFWFRKNGNLPLNLVSGSDHSWLEWRVLWRRHERVRGGQTPRGQSGGQQQLCVRRRGDKDREVYHQIKTEQEEGQYTADVKSLHRLFGAWESQISYLPVLLLHKLLPSQPEDVANEIHSNGQMFLLLFQEFDICGVIGVTQHQMH